MPFTGRRLRPAAGAGARADARRAGRRRGRDPLRHQRPALAHPGRRCRSSARRPRSRASGRPPRCGSRRARAPRRAVAEWMTHGHSEIDVHHSDIARFYPHQRTRAHVRLAHRRRRSTRPTASCTPASSGTASAASGSPRCTRPSRRPARCSSRPPAGSGRCGTPRNEALLGEYGDAVHAARARVGLPLVVADHQRRAPRHARARRHRRPVRVRDLRRRRVRARRTRCRASSWRRPTSAEGRVIYTPGARRQRAASAPTSP